MSKPNTTTSKTDLVEDPTLIDWPARQAAAYIPFVVVDGRPVNPGGPTGIPSGRGDLWHWGEQVCADTIVTATDEDGRRWLVMVERGDGHGWALPGGKVDPGEDPMRAGIRELVEETGLDLAWVGWQYLPEPSARYVPDPRASDEAWMVTVPIRTHLTIGRRDNFPEPLGADDAKRAAWVRADTYPTLVTYLRETFDGQVFAAHQPMLSDLFGLTQVAKDIASAIHNGDLPAACGLFDRAVQGDKETLSALLKALAATVEIPKGTIVVGFGVDVWANPHRDGYAWRCGDCRWTGSNYATSAPVQLDAEKHAADHKGHGEPEPTIRYYAEMSTT